MKASSARAAALSLVPGLGHWIAGKRWRAGALFSVDVGIVVSIFFLKSSWGCTLLILTYLLAMIPAVIETYALAQECDAWFSKSKRYILTMLLVTGLSALPLLWQTAVFTRKSKILVSVAVFILAGMKGLFFSFAIFWIWSHS